MAAHTRGAKQQVTDLRVRPCGRGPQGPRIWPHSVVLQAAALSCGLRTIARPLAPPTRQIRILTSMSAGTQRAGAGLCASPDPARRIGLHHHAHVPRPKRRPALCSLSCNPLPRPLPEDPRIRQYRTGAKYAVWYCTWIDNGFDQSATKPDFSRQRNQSPHKGV